MAKNLIKDVEFKASEFVKEIKDIRWLDVFKIFAIFFFVGALVFFGLFNNGAQGFARDGEFILLYSVMCLFHSLIDKVLFKGVKTIEVVKSNPNAYSIYMLAFAIYAIAAALIVK